MFQQTQQCSWICCLNMYLNAPIFKNMKNTWLRSVYTVLWHCNNFYFHFSFSPLTYRYCHLNQTLMAVVHVKNQATHYSHSSDPLACTFSVQLVRAPASFSNIEKICYMQATQSVF